MGRATVNSFTLTCALGTGLSFPGPCLSIFRWFFCSGAFPAKAFSLLPKTILQKTQESTEHKVSVDGKPCQQLARVVFSGK